MDAVLLGDIATWVGSVGTVAAFLVAFVQIRRERVERHRRERHDRLAEKRAHADRVSAWCVNGELHLVNDARHPAHAATVTFTDGTSISFDHILPGETVTPVAGAPDGPVASLTFSDTRGARWQRKIGRAPELLADTAHLTHDESSPARDDGVTG